MLLDIDLESKDWQAIGYARDDNQSAIDGYYTSTVADKNNNGAKTYFYGSFNGHGHIVSNLVITKDDNNHRKGYGS